MSDLDIILNLISDDVIALKIDVPLNNAMATCTISENQITNHEKFIRAIAVIVKHLYLEGLRLSINLSERSALNEAIWLLEKYYKGYETDQYDGAYYDTINEGPEGMKFISTKIVEILKSLERNKYISWVLRKNIDPRDWEQRKRMVEELMVRFGEHFTAELKQLTVSQLTPNLETLLMNFGSDSEIPISILKQNVQYTETIRQTLPPTPQEEEFTITTDKRYNYKKTQSIKTFAASTLLTED